MIKFKMLVFAAVAVVSIASARAEVGASWNGEACAGGACNKWNSDHGAVWTCAGDSAAKGGCMEWRSNSGVSWSCEKVSPASGECFSWRSNTGVSRPAACDKNGCEAKADVKEEFMPFFVQNPAGAAVREVQFEKANPSWDENGMGWVPCAEKDQQWQSTDNIWKTERKDGWEIYVCRYVVTYSCRWKNCTRPYPNTDPNSCSCKVSCRNSEQKTSDCHWEQIQAE